MSTVGTVSRYRYLDTDTTYKETHHQLHQIINRRRQLPSHISINLKQKEHIWRVVNIRNACQNADIDVERLW